MGFKKSHCIIKKMKLPNGQTANVIMLDSDHEVLEFDKKEDADSLAAILNENSDSGWHYVVKEI
jgi:hypothetical protein